MLRFPLILEALLPALPLLPWRPNYASSSSGAKLLFKAFSRSSYAYFYMLEVFYNLWISSYSSFSRAATLDSISILVLFSSRIAFINLFLCWRRFSCLSYSRKKQSQNSSHGRIKCNLPCPFSFRPRTSAAL